jgi:hypothetical protein
VATLPVVSGLPTKIIARKGAPTRRPWERAGAPATVTCLEPTMTDPTIARPAASWSALRQGARWAHHASASPRRPDAVVVHGAGTSQTDAGSIGMSKVFYTKHVAALRLLRRTRRT